MQDIIIERDRKGGITMLTTASSQSHYGIPVLRFDSEDIPSAHDYGPADMIALVNGHLLTGASIVFTWAMSKGRTHAEIAAARLFLSQWPDGPQIPGTAAAEYRCTRCGHKWSPREIIPPRVCPKCKSPY